MIKVNKCIGGPKLSFQFFARDELPWPVQQHEQDLVGLTLNQNLPPIPNEFACT